MRDKHIVSMDKYETLAEQLSTQFFLNIIDNEPTDMRW
jgi:hypothetical protein